MPKRKREYEFLIIRLRSAGQFVGVVKAPDAEAAKRAALSRFGIRPEDRIIAVRRGSGLSCPTALPFMMGHPPACALTKPTHPRRTTARMPPRL